MSLIVCLVELNVLEWIKFDLIELNLFGKNYFNWIDFHLIQLKTIIESNLIEFNLMSLIKSLTFLSLIVCLV